MNLSTAYVQWRAGTRQQGIQQRQREVVENLLKVRFRELDEALAARVPEILKLSLEEYMSLLMQLLREELLSRLTVNQADG
jgi:hypothetical protein